MNRDPKRFVEVAAAVLVMAVAVHSIAQERVSPAADPLAVEIECWSALINSNTANDEIWVQAKQAGRPALERAQEALRGGRRLLALLRLAEGRENLAAAAWVNEAAAQPRDEAVLSTEWKRAATVLRRELAAPSAGSLLGVRPAAGRALGEAALAKVRGYYDASYDYGHNTAPENGLFYIGMARADRDFTDLCRSLSAPSALAEPPLRTILPELDALLAEMLALYRPPASIDNHRQFIVASALLKEARELDATGLRYGALLRYLQASKAIASLRSPSRGTGSAAAAESVRSMESRLSAGGIDHSIGRLFLEEAQMELTAAGPNAGAAAAALLTDTLPRYFAALDPAPPRPRKPDPSLTVTMVRWPYT